MNTSKIIGINTATPFTEFAFIKGDEVVLSKGWKSDFNEAEKMLPVLKDAVEKAGTAPDKIFVVDGPGSFTGLRIGITIANTLALAYDVPITSMSTFEYLEAKLPEERRTFTAVLLRAGGQNVAVKLPGDDTIHRLTIADLENFFAGKNLQAVISDVKDEDRAGYNIGTLKWLQLDEIQPLADLLKSLNNPEEKKIIKPQYLSPPNITKSKKQIFA